MARKLKTHTTSAGFFDLAIAAPSKKAALEAWGSSRNLFQHGFAKQTDDPAIIDATMAKPGVVLRRPVGTNGSFSDSAELPRNWPTGGGARVVAKRPAQKARPAPKTIDGKTARRAALAFEREQERQRRQAAKEEAVRAKEGERRDRAIAAAELEAAKRVHRAAVEELEKGRRAIDRKLDAERKRWKLKEEQLERQLRRSRVFHR
jgi:colicin import membrane protein